MGNRKTNRFSYSDADELMQLLQQKLQQQVQPDSYGSCDPSKFDISAYQIYAELTLLFYFENDLIIARLFHHIPSGRLEQSRKKGKQLRRFKDGCLAAELYKNPYKNLTGKTVPTSDGEVPLSEANRASAGKVLIFARPMDKKGDMNIDPDMDLNDGTKVEPDNQQRQSHRDNSASTEQATRRGRRRKAQKRRLQNQRKSRQTLMNTGFIQLDVQRQAVDMLLTLVHAGRLVKFVSKRL